MAADGRIDRIAAREIASGERRIFPGHASSLQLPHQRSVRGQRLGHDHQAARVLVEAVDDAGARHASQLRDTMDERIGERSRPVPAPG